ncbi:hypothetical protein [Actinomadura sp. CNU-125]|uniref:hypothetical protein n=1 Tax=Actinomadura sp. CNU-125 TaxID=1904961 RepID=UPI0021CC5A40|nr:hypothetical protein [Actinomadura sp. CNU-125]
MSPRSSTAGPRVPSAPAAQHGGHGGQSLAGGDLQRQAVQGGEHLLLGARQIETELRLAVQVAAQDGQLFAQLGGVFTDRHAGMVRFTPFNRP